MGWLGTGWRRWAVLASALFFVGVLAASTFAPYSPLTVRSVEVVPERVCVEESVAVRVDRTWMEPWLLFSIRSVGTFSEWRNLDTGAVYSAADRQSALPDLDPLSGVVESDLVRRAPPEPGPYVLDTTYMVGGRTILLPAYQYLPRGASRGAAIDSDPVEVRECRSGQTTEIREGG